MTYAIWGGQLALISAALFAGAAVAEQYARLKLDDGAMPTDRLHAVRSVLGLPAVIVYFWAAV
jgi:hypothetical protein